MPGPAISTVLFDVGGPLNTEIEHERLIDADIVAALADEGISVTQPAYAEAVAWAVEHFAPDAHTAIIWRLSGGDPQRASRAYTSLRARAGNRYPFELREGIRGVIEWLHDRGTRLGLAANQPHATLATLDGLGLGRYFHHREVSGTHGFRKPDPRLFLRCCEDLCVPPEACIMVGDRIDNDIAPARLLGMRTILFRTGRHREQQPRSWAEAPHAEVRDVAGLRAALAAMLEE
ncbi:MAG TPA: HAD family hydrolase [Dehalococcoidia bacterium]|nr:HAD family hydrolase [Dehalococcoidia bacterium]